MLDRVSYKTAILIGGAGCVAPWIYPFLYSVLADAFGLAAQGRLIEELYWRLFAGRSSTFSLNLGLLTAPLAWAVFFVALYSDASGGKELARRIASGIAAGLMLVAAYYSVRQGLFFRGRGLGEMSALWCVWLYLNTGFLLTWALLLIVFARRHPLLSSWTPTLAQTLAVATASIGAITAYDMWRHDQQAVSLGRPRAIFLAVDAFQLAGFAAAVLFLIVLRRESRTRRRDTRPL